MSSGSSGRMLQQPLYKLPCYAGEFLFTPEDELVCRMAASLEVRNPCLDAWGSTLGSLSAKFWVQFSSHNTSNKVAGNITESSPGFVLWLLVFSMRFSSLAITSNFLSTLRKVCIVHNLCTVIQVTKEILNSEWLVCWDRSCYCF